MADAASGLTHLPDRKFLSHFCTHFPQRKHCRLPPLPFACRRQITTIPHTKQPPRVSPQPSSRRTPPPGSNGGASADGCKLPPILKALKTPLLSSIFFLSAYVMAFCPRKGNLSRSNQSRNTSSRSVKSLHPWGPTTPATTTWGNSTFGWDAIWRLIRRRILLQQ